MNEEQPDPNLYPPPVDAIALPAGEGKGQDILVTTDRLRLRRLRPDDLADLFALLSTEDVWQALGNVGPPSEDATTSLLKAMIAGQSSLDHAQAHRYTAAIEETATNRFIGFLDINAVGDLGDFSIALATSARGKGYSTEALPAFFGLCAKAGIGTILGTAKTANASSIAMMESAGMIEVEGGAENQAGEAVDTRTFEWVA